MFHWLYGHDSKCATSPWSRRIFYILRTCTCDSWKIFYRRRKSKSLPKSHTLCLWSSAKLQNILSFCVGFWQRLWLQKPAENFSCVVRIRSEYVKHSPRSGGCSALWAMTVQPMKHFLFDKVLMPPLYAMVWTPLHSNYDLDEGLSMSTVIIIQTHFHHKRRYADEIFFEQYNSSKKHVV